MAEVNRRTIAHEGILRPMPKILYVDSNPNQVQYVADAVSDANTARRPQFAAKHQAISGVEIIPAVYRQEDQGLTGNKALPVYADAEAIAEAVGTHAYAGVIVGEDFAGPHTHPIDTTLAQQVAEALKERGTKASVVGVSNLLPSMEKPEALRQSGLRFFRRDDLVEGDMQHSAVAHMSAALNGQFLG